MKTILFIVAALMLTTAVVGFGKVRETRGQINPEEAAVRETVAHYLHGLKFNDVDSLKLAFYPEAKLLWIKRDKQLGQLTQEQWYKGFAASAGKEEKGDLRITAVDVTGNAASVKVEEFYDTTKYTDYLSLLKLDGGWKIVNKIYVVEPIKK
jgi:hypothetical protein